MDHLRLIIYLPQTFYFGVVFKSEIFVGVILIYCEYSAALKGGGAELHQITIPQTKP